MVHPTPTMNPVKLGDLLADFLGGLVRFDLSCIHLFDTEGPPRLLHDGLRGHAGPENRALYEGGVYLLDPTYQHFVAGTESGFLPAADLVSARTVPGHLLSAGVFHPLLSLDRAGIAGHVAYLQRNGAQGVALCLMRLADGRPFSADEEQRLRDQTGYVTQVLARLAALAAPTEGFGPASQVPLSLESILSDQLPPRQSAVLALSVQGLSLDDIGLALGISPNTARAHLQSAYRRLGVRNKGEVFAIVLRRLGLGLEGSGPGEASGRAGRATTARAGDRVRRVAMR